DVVKVLTSKPEGDLRAALPGALVDALERERGFAQRLGIELQKRRDQVFLHDGRLLRLEKAARDEHADVARWVVRQVAHTDAGNAGSDPGRPKSAQSPHDRTSDAGTAGTSRTSASPREGKHEQSAKASHGEDDRNQSRESPQSPRTSNREPGEEG